MWWPTGSVPDFATAIVGTLAHHWREVLAPDKTRVRPGTCWPRALAQGE